MKKLNLYKIEYETAPCVPARVRVWTKLSRYVVAENEDDIKNNVFSPDRIGSASKNLVITQLSSDEMPLHILDKEN